MLILDVNNEKHHTNVTHQDDQHEEDIDIDLQLLELSFEDDNMTCKPTDNSKTPKGFTLCWDNVGKYSVARHQSRQTQNKMHNWALGYVAMNRVTTTNLDTKDPDTKAADIPISQFVPSVDDIISYRTRLTVITERILVKHIRVFRENFADCTTKHILHENSQLMKEKSELVCK